MLFQEATPDTSGYMIAGYVISFLVMGLYVASMYLRSRNLHQDESMLQEMDKPEPASVQTQSSAKAVGSKSSQPVTKRQAQK